MKKIFVFCLVILSLSFCFVGCGDDKCFEVISKEITDTSIKYELTVALPEEAAYGCFFSLEYIPEQPESQGYYDYPKTSCYKYSTLVDKDNHSTDNIYILSIQYDLQETSIIPQKLKLIIEYITPEIANKHNLSSDDFQSLHLLVFDTKYDLNYDGKYVIHDEPAENYLKYLKTLTYTLSLSEGE